MNSLVRTLLFSAGPNRLAVSSKTQLMRVAQRGMKSPPIFHEDNSNKINSFNGDLAAYFDDFMRRRPQTPGGYINLSKENFKTMIERSKTEKDL